MKKNKWKKNKGISPWMKELIAELRKGLLFNNKK